jgi:hypothetical protein
MRAVFRTRCLRIFPETSIPFPLEITGKFLGQPVGSSEIRSFPEAGIIELGIGYSPKKFLVILPRIAPFRFKSKVNPILK